MKKLLPLLFALMLVAGVTTHAAAIDFAVQSGDFTIVSVIAGAGTQADPFIVYETVTGQDVIMAIRGLPGFGNPSGSTHSAGFWLRKVVTNDTGEVWNYFDHELQETLGVASTDGDGLSFAQGYVAGRPWTSDKFSKVDEIVDVRDYVNFSVGSVADGETVTFDFVITDNSPVDLFFLRQRPNYIPHGVPEPATLLLLGTGLLGLMGARKKIG